MNDITNKIKKVLKSGGNIVDLAKSLDITISETSKLIGNLSSRDERLATLFQNWPKDVTSGYIYLGEKTPPRAKLFPGQYIFAEKLDKRNKSQKYTFYEIRLPKVIEECLYIIRITKKKPNIRRKNNEIILVDPQVIQIEEWWPIDTEKEKIIERFREMVAKYSNWGKSELFDGKKIRINYTPGAWVGVINGVSLLNVNKRF